MKKIIITIISLLIIVLSVLAVFLIPKLFPKDILKQTESETSSVSSVKLQINLTDLVKKCDTVFYGSVIKADIEDEMCVYTIQVSSVLLGRNLTSIGYVTVKGEQTFNLSNNYLFFARTNGGNKYHYIEPFEQAPWIFEVLEKGKLTHISKGDLSILQDRDKIELTYVKKICTDVVAASSK